MSEPADAVRRAAAVLVAAFGRETTVFHREPSGRWLAVHEYLSPASPVAG